MRITLTKVSRAATTARREDALRAGLSTCRPQGRPPFVDPGDKTDAVLEIRPEPLETGSVIANAYRLERVLGKGGMGVVWAARDVRTSRRVALKFLHQERAGDMRNQERFFREARAAMAVMHPAVARVEAVLETNAGVPFLVMELLEGEPLRALLMRRGTLMPFEVARLLLPVVDAVLAAHALGIVHRDLKPENVFLLQGSGAVRVLDFGIAKQLPRAGETDAPSLTSTGGIVGTPIYMAPEQIFGDADLDAAADVWSLGIMIYEALAGRAPTLGEGFGPVIRRITTDPIAPLEQLRPDAPRRITSLVDRMLIRDRQRRAPLFEVRAVLAGLADAGENAPRSIRTAEMMQPLPALYPPTGGTTTGGVAAVRPGAPKGNGAAIAVAGGLALVVLLGGGGAGVWYYVSRSADATRGPTTTGSAVAFQQATQLQLDAGKARTSRDGKTCLAKLDDYDRRFATPGLGPRSDDPKSGAAGIRAQCLMLVGKCQEGKKLYAAWVPQFSPPGQKVDFTAAIQGIVAEECEGSDLSPADALVRANHRLFGQAGSIVKTPSAAECQGLFAEEQRLRAQVPPAEALKLPLYAVTDPLGECITRSKAK